MAYRKAKRIELHEAHTAITTSEEQSTFATRGEQINQTAFSIRPSVLAALAGRLGLNVTGQVKDTGEMDGEVRPVVRAYQELPADTSGVKILSLECDVQDANLVDIRIESQLENAAPEASRRVEYMTHSGSFTIWWAEEHPSDVEQLLAVAEAHPVIPTEEADLTIARGTVLDVTPEEGNGDKVEDL